MQNKVLFVLAAPSGTGKTTVAQQLLDRDSGLVRSVSCTTRKKRSSEQDGECYQFVEEGAFLEMVEAGDFLEFDKIYGCFYGTPKKGINQAFARDKDVLLVVDWQGARQIKDAYKDCVTIFLVPPSYQALEDRLQGRGEDPEAVMARRLGGALEEFEHYTDFDYLVVNEDLRVCVENVEAVIKSERLKTQRQAHRCHDLLVRLRKEMSL